jgi:hypothetical protein
MGNQEGGRGESAAERIGMKAGDHRASTTLGTRRRVRQVLDELENIVQGRGGVRRSRSC